MIKVALMMSLVHSLMYWPFVRSNELATLPPISLLTTIGARCDFKGYGNAVSQSPTSIELTAKCWTFSRQIILLL
jgi:hypothetical protein